MTTPRKLLGSAALGLHLALLLSLSGLAVPASGPGYGAELLLGHLADPTKAALLRGGGLAAIGLTLLLFPRLLPAGAVGRGLLLAFLGGLVLWTPSLVPSWATGAALAPRLVLALVGLTVLALVSRLLGGSPPAEAPEDEPAPSATPTELLRDLGGGAGLALALGALWQRTALVGLHEPAEQHLRLAVLLGLAAIGSLAFGPALARDPQARRVVATVVPALVAVGCLVGLWLLLPATSNAGLATILDGLGGLDLSTLGGTEATTVLAARSLVAAGFALGLLLGAGARVPAALALGAGLGTALLPLAIERVATRPGPFAMQLALGGMALAALAAVPTCLVILRRGPSASRIALPLLAGVLAAGWFVPRADVRPLSPWGRVPVEPLWQADTALGLLTVEPMPLGDPVITIDRVLLTPPPGEVDGDLARLTAALDLAAANWQPGDPDLEVLLAGQLTLARLDAFERWDEATELDAHLSWTTPWDAFQDRIRPRLESTWSLPEPVPFRTAAESVGAGIYDLVIVPLPFGTALPALEAKDAPRAAPPAALPPADTSEDQPAVVFVAAEAPLQGARLGDEVLVAGSDLDHLGLGLVAGLGGGSLQPAGRPGPFPLGDRGLGALARLGQRAELRALTDRAATFGRLAGSAEDPFAAALAQFFRDQVRSSPWAEPDERLELDQARLEALAAATELPLTGLESLTWEHLARVLIIKRLSGETFAVVPGLLQRLDSFPPLEHALARAYFELLMPAEGAELLLPLYEAGWRAPEPLMDLAWALGRGGDWAKAAEVYGVVLEELPGFHHAARLRAMAELRAGLPEGPAHAAELLEEQPDDPELREYLLPGPLPDPPEGFDPNPLSRATEDGHEH